MAATEAGVDYKAVLKDLEAQKAKIDAAIAGVRQLLSMPSVVGGVVAPAAGESVDLADHPFLGMSIGDAAKKYLLIKRNKQSVKEIAEALERGGLHHVSKNFPATVATMINRYAKTDSEMISAGKGEWALAAWYGNRRPKAAEPTKKRKRARASKSATGTKTKEPTTKPQPAKAEETGPTARDMVAAVLKAGGAPLHIDAILGAIKARYGKDVSRGAIVTMIAASIRKGKQFKRTGPNTFALSEA